ncbi:H-NS histone family protein [Paraburkholderia sp. USG1]|uniref:H-NS histone family protein n=1 Tax=Paraburkholderia sp. USG1 TaxID=2952268 RepID=UPI00285921D6|nr:H-NS histone family protein [Paraburkholderia sp. USG1]MDR8398358.1 H-NS histone family protein [Paraburkholderia sp. USG1]
MATYRELLAQREKLDAEIQQARNTERAAVIAEIRQKLLDHQIGLDELAGRRVKPAEVNVRRPVAPRYRDPASGKEWSGRGKPPAWIKNAPDRHKFLIR